MDWRQTSIMRGMSCLCNVWMDRCLNCNGDYVQKQTYVVSSSDIKIIWMNKFFFVYNKTVLTLKMTLVPMKNRILKVMFLSMTESYIYSYPICKH
jgi:hypothetical protein